MSDLDDEIDAWEESDGFLEEHPRCSGSYTADGRTYYRWDTVWLTEHQVDFLLEQEQARGVGVAPQEVFRVDGTWK